MTNNSKTKAQKGLLFDLDGTLIDTSLDMGETLNELLEKHNKPALAQTLIRTQVSHGVRGLLKLGFNIDPDHDNYETLAKDFLNTYQSKNHQKSELFPGMESLLKTMMDDGIPLAIVTNKPRYLTEPLLERLEITQLFGCLICGDDLATRKPHPLPILTACENIEVLPEYSIYIGDAERDIEAGNKAGLVTMLVSWGYFDTNSDDIHNWQANHFIEDIAHLRQLLRQWI